ncbi:MAG: carboxylating nicotinate-nucleotide diphosphorylase [Bacteroidales bacterium]|jgi:nicotinate-nucleotide pyrophosphorylase (carboxylating)|nr:carboxylating nicotinate-nucleotide diphosphorylase [Bacteroidales bacterium]
MSEEEIIKQTLIEDIGAGDHTSRAAIPAELQGRMCLLVKENGIIAGVDVAKKVLSLFDPTIKMENVAFRDGDKVTKGDIVFTLAGSARSMLTVERTLLNFMQRMSGIATNTRRYVDLIADTHTRILDTRKTTPNMRVFEKQAVKIGGAANHRFGLFDMMMLKDNHIDFAGSIENAIDLANQYQKEQGLNIAIEIEARDLEQVLQIVRHGGVQRIMFDNFTPSLIVEAMKIVNQQYETEASGGITFDNLREYALTGVDFISVGALTHHIKSLDLSLKFNKLE